MTQKRKAASDFLKEYRIIKNQKRIIDEQMFSVSELYRELINTSSFAYSKGKGSDKHFNSYKKSLEEKMDELILRRNTLMLRQRTIESVVRNLNKTEAAVIRGFYIDGDGKRAADMLMVELEYEKSHIYRKKDRALDSISQMIDASAFPKTLS